MESTAPLGFSSEVSARDGRIAFLRLVGIFSGRAGGHLLGFFDLPTGVVKRGLFGAQDADDFLQRRSFARKASDVIDLHPNTGEFVGRPGRKVGMSFKAKTETG